MAAVFVPPEQVNIATVFLGDRITNGDGDRMALRLPDRTMTYADVEREVSSMASVLEDLGVRRERRVVILLPDGGDYVAALFATLRLGAVVVMVNPALDTERIATLVEMADAAAVVTTADLAAANEGAFGQAVLVRSDTDEWRKAGAGPPVVATHRDDPAIWLFSGGTTGTPKAVVQTHGSFLNTTVLYGQRTLLMGPDDITMSIPKLIFGYATGANLFFPFSVGASAVLFPEHPTVEVVLRHLRHHRPTILIDVPTMIGKLLADPGTTADDFRSLRLSTSAGEPLPVELHLRWDEATGVELLDGLGTAEMWHVFVTNKPGDVRPGTLGTEVDGFEIRVCDEEGTEVPDGEVGRLWVRGNSRAWGYWRDLHRTAKAFRGEWVVPGDLVHRNPTGAIVHHGRADDALKISGRWLAPQEVEGCLLLHPEVVECVVVGIPDAAGLVKPVAFVVATSRRPGLEKDLVDHALDHLEAYKHPRRVVLVEAFPTTHLGKIDRRALSRMG